MGKQGGVIVAGTGKIGKQVKPDYIAIQIGIKYHERKTVQSTSL